MVQRSNERESPSHATDNRRKASVLSRLGDVVDSPRHARTSAHNNNSNDNNNGDSNNSQHYNGKRQRLHSSSDNEAEDDSATTSTTDALPVRKKRAVAAPADSIARSRRMFGALMGHLGQAKAQIERDSALLKRQGSKQHDAEVRDAAQRQALAAERKALATVRSLEAQLAQAKRDQMDAFGRLTRAFDAQTQMRKTAKGFLQTTSTPSIYYLPAKLTPELSELVAAADEALAAKQLRCLDVHEKEMRTVKARWTEKLEALQLQLKSAKQQTENQKQDDRNIDKKEQENRSDRMESKSDDDDAQLSGDDGREDDKQDSMNDEEVDAVDDEQVAAHKDANVDEDTVMQSAEMDVDADAVDDAVDDVSAENASVAETSPMDMEPTAAESPKASSSSPLVETVDNDSVNDDSDNIAVITAESTDEAVATTATSPTASPDALPALDVSALKVTELREQLKQRGLDTRGLKGVLVARLEAAMQSERGSDAA